MQTIQDIIATIAGSIRSSAMSRRGFLTAIVMLLAVPFIVVGSNRSIDSMFNAPLRWIPRDSESRQEFNRFLELFGSHETVLVSWPGCDVDDPRLDEIAALLQQARQRRRDLGQPAMINHVLTGNALLRQLTDPPVRLSRDDALRRLSGVVVGPDGKTSCVLVEVTDFGAEHRREMTKIIIESVAQVTGLDVDEMVLAGPPIDGIAIDNESVRSIQTYSLPSILISLILCWVCLRSLWLSIPILLVGLFGQGLMLAMVHWTGSRMNAVLIVLPALVLVLSVSAGVHLVNYFIEELGLGSDVDAPRRAMTKALGPCLLAALTTAIGLSSLSVSTVQPVHDFGVLGAVGLLICMALLFLLVPAFMTVWLQLPWSAAQKSRSAAQKSPSLGEKPLSAGEKSPSAGEKSGAAKVEHPIFGVISAWVWRHSVLIRVSCLAAMVGLGTGLVWLRTSVDVVSLLSPENRAVRDFHWFEEHIGPLVPVEVIVQFDPSSTLTTLERLNVVTLVQKKVAEIEILSGDVSVATFLPPVPRSASLVSTARRSAIRKLLTTNRDEFIEAKYLADAAGGEAWRISARIVGRSDFDHGQFLEQLQAQVDELLKKFDDLGYEGISASCTGVTAVVQGVQESLLDDLFNSFLIALLLVAVVMMLALRSVLCGLLAMIPNVFPTLLLFGRMGWADDPVDIGSVMTASVALGIAVDGTFHFLKWFRHSLKQGKTQERAISIAFEHCGRALVQSTVICASGLLIFSFSGFLPVRNFSLMMMMMLAAALVGDLILLPALLAGRLGTALSRVDSVKAPAKQGADDHSE